VARLRRTDLSVPGIHRLPHGDGFRYELKDGSPVDEPEVIERIDELAIPPAWRDVWISPYPNGHLQAIGTDAAGRKQYRYHVEWRRRRDQEKFDEMLDFARALPGLRRRVVEDLNATDKLTRDRVLAGAVRLLDRGFFRIGSEDYAVRNESYGLATMRKEHARLSGGALVFNYVAKSGKQQVHGLLDPDLYEIVGRLKRRRGGGPELLAYQDGRRWRDIKSTDINAYLKEATGADYSAKDFRTWNATALAAVALAVAGEVAGTKTGRKRAINRAVKEVAHYLGNTPAVCRASYIDPRVFDRYESKWVISTDVLSDLGEPGAGELPTHRPRVHEAVIDLLTDSRENDALEKVA
jgi:DNA topoisomerase IB